MNGRIYDPNLGRFMSVDPFIQSPTNTQSINAYSYIMNNPVNGIDPSGYFAVGSIGESGSIIGCEADGVGQDCGIPTPNDPSEDPIDLPELEAPPVYDDVFGYEPGNQAGGASVGVMAASANFYSNAEAIAQAAINASLGNSGGGSRGSKQNSDFNGQPAGNNAIGIGVTVLGALGNQKAPTSVKTNLKAPNAVYKAPTNATKVPLYNFYHLAPYAKRIGIIGVAITVATGFESIRGDSASQIKYGIDIGVAALTFGIGLISAPIAAPIAIVGAIGYLVFDNLFDIEGAIRNKITGIRRRE
ncbi:hypothetical protein FNN08_14350 [Thalassomonas sp. M1454]|nr:RHS repeat-associated core domain-containing protein [Thalassomonas sp. M1454]TRX53451.1 hypothetical protein FNN08_14350 [Thalassomonas sp. M1454]